MQCLLLSENAVPIVRVLNLISNKIARVSLGRSPVEVLSTTSTFPPFASLTTTSRPFPCQRTCGQLLLRPVSTVRGLPLVALPCCLRCSALKPCCCVHNVALVQVRVGRW